MKNPSIIVRSLKVSALHNVELHLECDWEITPTGSGGVLFIYDVSKNTGTWPDANSQELALSKFERDIALLDRLNVFTTKVIADTEESGKVDTEPEAPKLSIKTGVYDIVVHHAPCCAIDKVAYTSRESFDSLEELAFGLGDYEQWFIKGAEVHLSCKTKNDTNPSHDGKPEASDRTTSEYRCANCGNDDCPGGIGKIAGAEDDDYADTMYCPKGHYFMRSDL